MSFIQNLREYFYQRTLRSSEQQAIERSSIDFKQINRVGILFDGTALEQRKIVIDYAAKLEKQGKRVTLLGYLALPKRQENITFRHYSQQEIDWQLHPKSTEVEEFQQQPFDVLLVLHLGTNLQFESIAIQSKAKFRVGPMTNNTNAYDLLLEVDPNQQLNNFIQQVEKYLNKTTTVHEQSTI